MKGVLLVLAFLLAGAFGMMGLTEDCTKFCSEQGGGAPVPFTPCPGTYDLTISCACISPSPPKKGQAAHIAMQYDLTKTITGGQYEAKVSYMGIQVLDQKDDVCNLDPQGHPCPWQTATGAVLAKDFDIPSASPSGTYKVSLSATDQDGSGLFCCDLSMKIAQTDTERAGTSPAHTMECDFV
eukprot:TRINITY_DN38454_c0_g1_i1.p2 TRINITY_DN38454_c0_g1~~TRINITY_DN38454_c0_g1_i1.p2  ORF type:complete len:182 (-),score=39.15 TRINITY_DN38454_c0_g1_i1:54-599(-)